MQKSENGIIVWLKQPSTWWKIGWVVIALISIYYNLNYRITALEEFKDNVDIVQIQTDLAQIKADLQWVKNDLQKNR